MTIQEFAKVDIWTMRKLSLDGLALRVFKSAETFANRDGEHAEPRIYSASSYGYDWVVKKKSTSKGLIAVIPLDEIMTRYDSWYGWGTELLAAWIMEAADDDDIVAVVLSADCYGGDASGIELVEAAVKYCNGRKPIIAHVVNSYSGSVWATIHARHIMIESQTVGGTGSIGVYSTHMDYADFFKEAGISIEMIRAEGSEKKALNNSIEKLSEEARANVRAKVTAVREAFISTVRSARSGVSDEVFDGKEFNGLEAKRVGLVDSFGFLGDALSLAAEMAS